MMTEAKAQIRFKLSQESDTKTFVVSIIPDKTYSYPDNIVSTAQVTFKIKSKEDFMLSHFKAQNSDESWMTNSIVKSPALAPDYDYYSYGLQTMGSSNYSLEKGKETILFSFENLGKSTVIPELIENTDIMAISVKKTRINLGNQISILGIDGGKKNAYLGNVNKTEDQEINLTVKALEITNLYPNPATDKIQVEWQNNLDLLMDSVEMSVVRSGSGTVLKRFAINDIQAGKNVVELNVSDLVSGNYMLRLESKSSSPVSAHFVLVK